MLDDKYRIDRLLAVGGMGAVYVGTHIKLRKRVAIKVLNPQLSSAPMIERFHREAITASQIGHEGIAQVTDIGTSSDGEPFLVMEYLEGEPLAARLLASGPLAIEDACELGCAILSPLSAAHRAGIVHRDLKPDNVFLVRQSRGEMVKLLDFGISRASGLDSEFRLTNTGLVLGTPYYMSPEQARGESEITPAADLYAFGVMLYEMLIGDVPIRAENYNQLMYRVMIGDFERPRDKRPELPEALERIILHAMAQLPADRPVSALELEQALLPFCRPLFRDHASGRISSPALPFRVSMGSGGIDPRLFAGPTMSDTAPEALVLPAGDTEQGPAVSLVGELAAFASQPALSAAADATLDDMPRSDSSLYPYVAPSRSPVPRILAAIALVVVAAAATGWGLTRAGRGHPPVVVVRSATNQAPVTPVAPQATGSASGDLRASGDGSAAATADHPAAPAATTITVQLSVQPPGATIAVDGERVSGSELVVPRDRAAHRLRITAAGYLAYDAALSYDENQRLIIRLERAGSTARVKDPHKDHPTTERPERTNRIESKSPYE